MNKLIQLSSRNFLMTAFGMSVFMGACNQNPFPQTGGDIKPVEEKPNAVAPAFSIEVSQVLSCEEGKECVSPLVGRVPGSGNPIMTLEGLPPGASFDQSTGLLKYTPAFDTVDIAKDPATTVKNFVVTANLRSDQDSITNYRKQFLISVKNVLRPVTIQADQSDFAVVEGRKASQLVTLSSEDFPAGPFYLNFQDQPQGLAAVAVAGDPTKFQIEYTPSYFTVTPSDPVENGHYVKKFAMAVLVSTPAGQTVSQTLNWSVVDKRMAPVVSAPSSIKQGPIVNFTIRAEDSNGERPPVIQVNTNVPFGTLKADRISSDLGIPGVSLPSTVFNVRWEDIPYDKIGQIQTISALICGPSTVTQDTICTNSATRVEITGNTHRAPIMDRSKWPVSTINYFKIGTPTSFAIPVTDAEDARRAVTVEVLPASMAAYVKYQNGQLVINTPSTGVQQFTIKATSQFQQSIVESFLFEALPATWSDVAILTGGSITPEVTALKDFIKRADVLSSEFQISERNLALRRTVIVTSSALQDGVALENIEKAAGSVANIVVLSPLVGTAGQLTTELTNLGAQFRGRLTDAVTNYVLSVDSKSGLRTPHVPLGLKGTATSESNQPAMLEAGVSGKCQRLFSLQKSGQDLSVGIRCRRNSGASLTATGFEFSDLAVSESDKATVSAWLDTLMSNSQRSDQ